MKFLYGDEDYLVNLEAKKIEKKSSGVITHYDETDDIETIIMDVSTMSMFSDEKVIFIKNHPMLKDVKLGESVLSDFENETVNTEVIFILESSTLNKKNPLITLLLSKAEVFKFDRIESKNLVPTVKDIVNFRGGTISNSAAIKLVAKLPDNLRLIVTEIKKLLSQSENITDEMIEVSVGEYITEDYFGLTNAITSLDKQSIVASFKDKMDQGEPIPLMIGQIASVLNLTLLVAAYRKQGLSNGDISSEMKIHVFRVKKASELLNSSSEETIKKLLLSLAELDKNIKTGKVDEKVGINNFILNLIK